MGRTFTSNMRVYIVSPTQEKRARKELQRQLDERKTKRQLSEKTIERMYEAILTNYTHSKKCRTCGKRYIVSRTHSRKSGFHPQPASRDRFGPDCKVCWTKGALNNYYQRKKVNKAPGKNFQFGDKSIKHGIKKRKTTRR